LLREKKGSSVFNLSGTIPRIESPRSKATGETVTVSPWRTLDRRTRHPAITVRPNEKWSMDFVAARLLDGRWFRVLTVVDQFTRECPLLLADSSMAR
jgi:transposase InsO family protein